MRQAVPVRGSIVGHNYYDSSDRDIGYGALGLEEGQRESDILPYSRIYAPVDGLVEHILLYTYKHNFTNREFYIRFAQPHFAKIVETYLDISCSFSGSNGIKVVFSDCNASSFAPQTLSRNQIDSLWYKATGKTASLTGNGWVSCVGLSLKNIIPSGIGEIFALCLAFDTAPQDFFIEKLNLSLGTELLV